MKQTYSVSLSFLAALILCCSFILSASVHSQEEPEFKNLKIFKKDITRPELIGKMREMSISLGVRCGFCHKEVMTDGNHEMDFASDEKENKETARVMLRMTENINSAYLSKLHDSTETHHTAVTCYTCHHNNPEPRVLATDLEDALNSGGVDSAVSLYHELKKEFYGRSVYDFSEEALNSVAVDLASQGNKDGAFAILKLNEEEHPGSFQVKRTYAIVYMRLDMIQEAITTCEEILKENPDDHQIQQMLQRLKSNE